MVAAKVVDLIVHNKPSGWGRRSQAPYFKEVFAKQIKIDIDKMIDNGNPLLYRYSLHCNKETGVSKGTLYSRIYQSIRYLLEHMDADKRYRKWADTVRLKRESPGIVIRYITGLSDQTKTGFAAEEILPRDHIPKWRLLMEEWLEGTSVKPFCIEGLVLTAEEITELRQQLSRLDGIESSISSSSIKIIRTNE